MVCMRMGRYCFPYLHEITGRNYIPQVWKEGDIWTSPLETIESCCRTRLGFHDVWMDHNASTVFMDDVHTVECTKRSQGMIGGTNGGMTEQP